MVTSATAKSLEEFMLHPIDQVEWVDGQLIEKNGMTLKHSAIQSKLDFHWRSYMLSSARGGQVYTEAPCRTTKQVRRPDVAYWTPELLAQFGEAAVLPQSFPLITEVISPTDVAEDVFLKAQEYLRSGCQEVWLLFPESCYVMIITQTQRFWFAAGDVVNAHVLRGFSISVNELLA